MTFSTIGNAIVTEIAPGAYNHAPLSDRLAYSTFEDQAGTGGIYLSTGTIGPLTSTQVIATTIAVPVTLGGAYRSPLTITSTGAVEVPSMRSEAPAVYVPASLTNVMIFNYGNINASDFAAGVSFAGSGTLINHGQITSFDSMHNGDAGIILGSHAKLINFGTVIAGNRVDYASNGVTTADGLINYGLIQGGIGGATSGAGVQGSGTVINDGRIAGGYSGGNSGGAYGVSLTNFSTLVNNGLIISGGNAYNVNAAGAGLAAGDVLINHGTILGGYSGKGAVGVQMEGGTLINYGTIGKGIVRFADLGVGTIAVQFGASPGTLVVEPGAVFQGRVIGNGSDVLELAGSSGSFDRIGSKILGFNDIVFQNGAHWQLGGNLAGLAAGQTISGFAAGDSIALAGFSEHTFSYVSGIGLEITNAKHITKTLDITGNFSTSSFLVTDVTGGTEIRLAGAAQIAAGPQPGPETPSPTHIINTTLTAPVTLGGVYLTPLTITQTGAVEVPTSNSGPFVPAVYVPASLSNVLISNYGTITSGNFQPEVSFAGSGTFINHGKIFSPASMYGGGAGIILGSEARLINFGNVTGGGNGPNGYGGNGVTTADGLTNYGVIQGGIVGITSGDGVQGSGTVINEGRITGGYSGNIEAGGYGVSVSNFSTVENRGLIVGGSGGFAGNYAGVGLAAGDELINTGTIVGGSGRAGGVGVHINGGILVNAGTISKGAGYSGGQLHHGVGTIAVQFGTSAGTLVVDPGAVFDGRVIGNGGDVLALAGSSGSFAGVGSQEIGFSDIVFENGARWQLGGNLAGLAAGQTISGFAANDTLVLDGFIASSSSVVAGVGLVLSNGFSTATLDITGSFGAGDYTLSSTGSGTEIQHTKHVIDTEVLNSVTLGAGVYLSPLTVTSTGRVTSNYIGVVANDGGTLINQGLIYGGGEGGGPGVAFNDGGTVINSGEIRGSDGSVDGGLGVSLNQARLINTGTIYGGGNGNLHTTQGAVSAYKSNIENYGVIIGGTALGPTGGGDGVEQTSGTLFNAGTIIGGNGTYGRYGSGPVGVGVYGTGTLINAGTIIGGTDDPGGETHAVDITTLVIEPGAAFSGLVIAKTLDFAAGTVSNSGSFDMNGTFSGFTSIEFNADAHFLLAGNAAELAGGETINGFTVGDTLVLEGFTATSKTYLIGAGLKLSNGTITETLGITGDFSTSSFVITDTAQGTEIVVCYLRGTRIATPEGERAIETLAIGDAVLTRFGGVRQIKWIGRQSFAPRFIAGNYERTPVRIKAGALGAKLPSRDLFVSPGHSMLLGSTLVLAKALINGVTITQDQPDADVHYYLIEFETHDCVRADGAWSESFADGPGLRNQFHNVGEFFALYPEYRTPELISLCAARPEQGERLAKAVQPVVARAARMVRPGALRGSIDLAGEVIEGWAQDLAHPRLPVLMEILGDGRVIGEVLACDYRADLAAAGIGAGRAHFAFRPKLHVPAKDLRVRRKGDGAEIYLSEDCRLRAAL